MGVKIQKLSGAENQRLYWCPACKIHHVIDDKWTYTGTEEKPTVRASVKAHWVKTPDPMPRDEDDKLILGKDGRIKGAEDMVCHHFITDGEIKYLNDCTHEFAGKTLPMEDFDGI